MQEYLNLFEGVIGRKEFFDQADQINPRCNLIAIWSPGDFMKLYKDDLKYIEDYYKKANLFNDYIRFDFWDTENNVPGYPTINQKQALELISFIDKHMDESFLIHCDAGQSRSAGVSMAVECIIKFNADRYQFSLCTPYVGRFERYSPNYEVFKIIMDTYERVQSGKLQLYTHEQIFPQEGPPKYTKEEYGPLGSNPFMSGNESEI